MSCFESGLKHFVKLFICLCCSLLSSYCWQNVEGENLNKILMFSMFPNSMLNIHLSSSVLKLILSSWMDFTLPVINLRTAFPLCILMSLRE